MEKELSDVNKRLRVQTGVTPVSDLKRSRPIEVGSDIVPQGRAPATSSAREMALQGLPQEDLTPHKQPSQAVHPAAPTKADTLVEDDQPAVAEAVAEQGAVQTGEPGEQAKGSVQTEGPGQQAKGAVQTEGPGELAKGSVQSEGPGEQAKGTVQTGGPGEAKGAVQTGGPVQTEGPGEAKGAVQTEGPGKTVGSTGLRSLDSMSTLSWGRRISVESLVPDTPMKQPVHFLEQQALELQGKLFQAFGDGATFASDDEKGRRVLGDLVTDWLIELQGSEYPPVQPGAAGDTMAISAVECLDAWAALRAVAKKEADLQEQLQAKMAHADQAVAKALSSVVQHAGQAGAFSNSAAVTQRMAAWKRSLQEQGEKEIQGVKEQLQMATSRLEAGISQTVAVALQRYDEARPRTEDEIVGALMLQVEEHMQSLQLIDVDPASAGGTGGTAMDVDAHDTKEAKLREMVNHGLLLERNDGPLCPEPVLEAAKGKKYSRLGDRVIINRLFEEWVQASENWASSAIVFNASLSRSQRRRGRYVMKTFKDLKLLYGAASAKAIRERKKEMGSDWWWPHPEMADNEEWECFKVYDSMEFEDDETSTAEHQFRAEGALDGEATRGLVCHDLMVMSAYHQPGAPAGSGYQFGVMRPAKAAPPTPGTPAPGGSGGNPGQETTGKGGGKKGKAPSLRSEKMKEGYAQELDEGTQVVETARGRLEEWYARKIEDADIVGEERGIYDEAMRAVDQAFTVLAGKIKAVKTATVSRHHRRSRKPRARVVPSLDEESEEPASPPVFCRMCIERPGCGTLITCLGRSVSTPLHAYVMKTIGKGETSFAGAREMLDAVNKEFQGHGMELAGAAGELISTSGRWPSNIQRDMLRRCKASKVPVTKLAVPVILKGTVKRRTLPVALPHEVLPWLVQRGIFPLDDSAEIVRFWTHARSVGLPTGGATDFHIPLWIWGDDAKFTETHQDKLVVVAFGRLLETSKNALKTVWPLFTYQQVVKSFNILFEEGVMVTTPSGQRKRVYAAVVQYQGDWKWHKA
ncbi:unnamed protein product [Symbiodinium sp. CCMP2456]|nr:unnamed protein product [Symbiodinium sp. CCMP2456]